jgi:hypothetical protein
MSPSNICRETGRKEKGTGEPKLLYHIVSIFLLHEQYPLCYEHNVRKYLNLYLDMRNSECRHGQNSAGPGEDTMVDSYEDVRNLSSLKRSEIW